MGVIDRARAAARAWREPVAESPVTTGSAIAAAADGLNDVGGATFLNLLGSAVGGTTRGEGEIMSFPAVLRALEVMCGLFSMAPLIYYRRDGDDKVRVDDAPQAKMLRTSANAVQSAFLLKEVMLGDLLMRGRFGAFIHRDSLYRPAGLSRLRPDGLVPVSYWDRVDGLEMFYDAQLPDGSRDRLTRNDCWYVSGFSRDGLAGVDRMKLLADTFEEAKAASAYAARFWANNAQPSTILTTKAKVDSDTKAAIKTDWIARFAGPRNAGAVAVLDQEMDAKFLAHDNKAAQAIETRGFHVVEICRAFGVPPHVLFELSRATFSNIEQQSLELILYSMMTHFERFAAAATHQFAEPGHFYEVLVDALLKGDIKSRYDAYAVAVDKGVLNPNEVRRKENLNGREGGDAYRVGSGSTLEGQARAAPVDHRTPAPPARQEEDD